mmetsp:Transcript_32925/g.52743  ORF Transcript_32925/g.52743 Transcript_32925/m.52743 type:complete len:240 (+) Transcript_32925:315-1034(+)|eukprot:CAMPEP_0198706082 /NCGR_PEP_ID=MMETSP1468-20131203/390772_1 /TAXON_ID=1461545 /ORGANISM="Mantoniella sp, Strain CCMP1436" /LENGTH=239 /DNA_ID=CAMNT_0044465005 /DNA_START=707 /DNA_END=1426 /DNA_ORIENTATION=-
MRAAAKSRVFAGEESEDEESDDEDDDWLNDVEDEPKDLNDDELCTSESTEHPVAELEACSKGNDSVGIGAEADKANAEGGKESNNVGRGVGVVKGGRGATGSGDSKNALLHPANAAMGAGPASARTPAPERVPNSHLQRKVAGKIARGKRALYYTHVSGREIAASYMNSTGVILQETSQQIQEISNAVRVLQNNLWELAATGSTPWQRVPNNVHIPPDIYEKYNRTPGFVEPRTDRSTE